ncbi:MAG TPA: hypothetical protein VF736_13915 [Pyrinomonadaceae bacterium]|jgi:hypothetical protein
MKTREHTKAAGGEPPSYASAARPPAPGGLTKAGHAAPAQAEPAEDADAGAKRRWLRWAVGLYVAVATVAVALGNTFDSIYWASIALFFAVASRPRGRVSKPLRFFATAAVLVLAVVQIVKSILKARAG